MNNYYASEHALTKQTKVLWENKPTQFIYPEPDIPYQYNSVSGRKYFKQPKNIAPVKISEDEIDSFQQHRLFSVIRGMDGSAN